MIKFMRLKIFCIVSVIVGMVASAADNAPLPFVSPMFGDNMVLQRGKPIRFWGWAMAGEKIQIELAGRTAAAKAGADGRWQSEMAAPAPGGPYTVKISGAEKSVTLHEVLVGDVWLCGGQSNMELPLNRTENGEQAIKEANHPTIRLFTVNNRSAYAPVSIVQGSWKVCSPKTVTEDGGFSAAGYYFGLKIQSETNVPIGLIQDCIGGTPAESWTSAQALRQLKDFDAPLQEVARLHANGAPEYGNYITHWYDEYDIGQKGKWEASDLDDSDWKTVTIPGGFKDLGVAGVPGVCYFRKEIVLPDLLPPGTAFLRLGIIEKMDTTYVNGHWVGASAWVENPRSYRIGDGILKPGTNVVTVRVFKTMPDGGFESKPDQLQLVLGDKTKIPLAGEWKGKLSVDARSPHPLPLGFENWPVMPGVLYNGMIAPVAPLALAGVIWYQGEANASRAVQYRTLLPLMIADWRRTFGQDDLPFYIVSLASFMQHRDTPGDDGWAELREAQALTASTVTNSGLAVTIDIGDANNIHPTDKKDVGERLALWALAKQYDRKVVFTGPTFASVEHMPGALKLHFDHTEGGLVVKGGKLGEFAVAGKDHKWYWADAKFDGGAVIVSCSEVPEPEAARYAWQSNPVATLYNGAGLPAVPFRTDHWQGATDKAKPW